MIKTRNYFSGVIIFNEDGDKRTVPLKPGVNIITGDSKTGKSALVEIIDYCLCSSKCTIPKGKITEFAHLYVLLMNIGDSVFVIAREKYSKNEKMYIVEEKEVSIDQITLSYFTDKELIQIKEAQIRIESALGLHVSNLKSDFYDKNKKASLRNMVSYLFQHQNLMASKFALFYRFTNYYKRKDTIDQFPVFAGLIGQEYYSNLIELSSLESELRKKERERRKNAQSEEYIRSTWQPLLKDYYALLNINLEENLSIKQMKLRMDNLPKFDDTMLISNDGIRERYNGLINQLEKLRDQEREYLIKIDNLKKTQQNGNDLVELLEDLDEQNKTIVEFSDEYKCPICGNDCNTMKNEDEELVNANQWLSSELEITTKYTYDFSEELRILNEGLSKIEKDIKRVWGQIKNLENKFISSKELISTKEKANYAMAKIKLYADMDTDGIFSDVDESILDLKRQITEKKEKIDGYNLDIQLKKAEKALSKNMNKLAKELDFEDEYKPLNLKFDISNQTFDIYHKIDAFDKIYLYEMGSGANWVSCHIALFLSFLRYFAGQSKSSMPLFLFFDQPSQVYFPQGDNGESEKDDTSNDIVAVNKMYQTIFDEIASIGEDTGITPQILIVDHVSGSNLKVEKEFNSFVRKNWRKYNSGEKGLI
jgi:hypothetical protein